MPLTHDIGVRIPYPLPESDRQRSLFSLHPYRTDKPKGMRAPGDEQTEQRGQREPVRFAESQGLKAREAGQSPIHDQKGERYGSPFLVASPRLHPPSIYFCPGVLRYRLRLHPYDPRWAQAFDAVAAVRLQRGGPSYGESGMSAARPYRSSAPKRFPIA